MKTIGYGRHDGLSETDEHGGYAGGLPLEGIGSELRALYDEVTSSQQPEDLVELAERLDWLAVQVVTQP